MSMVASYGVSSLMLLEHSKRRKSSNITFCSSRPSVLRIATFLKFCPVSIRCRRVPLSFLLISQPRRQVQQLCSCWRTEAWWTSVGDSWVSGSASENLTGYGPQEPSLTKWACMSWARGMYVSCPPCYSIANFSSDLTIFGCSLTIFETSQLQKSSHFT